MGCVAFVKKFDRLDMVVSVGRHKKKYYYKGCADRLNII
jgi:hypothetical protein